MYFVCTFVVYVYKYVDVFVLYYYRPYPYNIRLWLFLSLSNECIQYYNSLFNNSHHLYVCLLVLFYYYEHGVCMDFNSENIVFLSDRNHKKKINIIHVTPSPFFYSYKKFVQYFPSIHPLILAIHKQNIPIYLTNLLFNDIFHAAFNHQKQFKNQEIKSSLARARHRIIKFIAARNLIITLIVFFLRILLNSFLKI